MVYLISLYAQRQFIQAQSHGLVSQAKEVHITQRGEFLVLRASENYTQVLKSCERDTRIGLVLLAARSAVD